MKIDLRTSDVIPAWDVPHVLVNFIPRLGLTMKAPYNEVSSPTVCPDSNAIPKRGGISSVELIDVDWCIPFMKQRNILYNFYCPVNSGDLIQNDLSRKATKTQYLILLADVASQEWTTKNAGDKGNHSCQVEG